MRKIVSWVLWCGIILSTLKTLNGMKQHPLRQIFEKLVNKNAIKRKIGGPPLAIFPETLDPPLGILAKTSRTPSPGFSTRVHL